MEDEAIEIWNHAVRRAHETKNPALLREEGNAAGAATRDRVVEQLLDFGIIMSPNPGTPGLMGRLGPVVIEMFHYRGNYREWVVVIEAPDRKNSTFYIPPGGGLDMKVFREEWVSTAFEVAAGCLERGLEGLLKEVQE